MIKSFPSPQQKILNWMSLGTMQTCVFLQAKEIQQGKFQLFK